MNKLSKLKAKLGVAVAAGLPAITQAAVDVSNVTTEITDVKAGVLLIGAAVVSVAVGIKLYKWIKQAL